ncbi:hypothetical protein AaE_004717 [Aphanomyces astaci]|uniref:Uncharacterized protein n=1 Tax=Aphanomyces astaci TaxID=112090 RepID=A0A6A5A9V1_APHAT|nr:hypothetical protein AaE_004717 [Aphanomyces astaci]
MPQTLLNVTQCRLPSAATVTAKQFKLFVKFVQAVAGNRRIVTKWLLWRGANSCINQLNEEGRGALHIACYHGNIDMVNLLLTQGADAHLMSMEEGGNLQPLHFAIMSGCDDVVIALLLHNVNVNCLSENHETPLHFAVQIKQPRIVDLLLKHNANQDIRDMNGKTSYELALDLDHNAVLDVFAVNQRLHRRTPKRSQFFN